MYDDYYEEDFNEDYNSEYCEGDDYCGNDCDNCPYVTDDDGNLDWRTTIPIENAYLVHKYDELPFANKANKSSFVIKKFNDPITLAKTGKIQTKTF